jgi:peptidoglycan hydrolase CwlO-like protein
MFDLFGMEKANTVEAIRAMVSGVTTGLIDSFEYKIQEKERMIEDLKKKITELQDRIEVLEVEIKK